MVKLTFRKKKYEVRGGVTLGQALEKCGLNPHMVLAVRQGKLVAKDLILNDGDELKLVAVISGGKDSARPEMHPGQPTTAGDKCAFCRLNVPKARRR